MNSIIAKNTYLDSTNTQHEHTAHCTLLKMMLQYCQRLTEASHHSTDVGRYLHSVLAFLRIQQQIK